MTEMEDKLKRLEKQHSEELTKKPSGLIRQLRQFRSINQFMADGRTPYRLTDFYRYCKEIAKKWTIKEAHETVSLMRRHMKLTKEEAISKLIADIAHEYTLLYEWAIGIENGWEYGELKGLSLAAVHRSMILQLHNRGLFNLPNMEEEG